MVQMSSQNAGKTCCKKELKIDNFNEIPDFTRFKKTSKDATHHNLHLKYENIEDIKNKTSRKKTALEYLLLREEILEIPNLKYHVLTDIYAISKIRELESSEIEHIINIEKNAPKKLKLFNLLKVYSYLYHLKIALTYEPNNRFLNDVKNHLIKYSELSDKQTVLPFNFGKFSIAKSIQFSSEFCIAFLKSTFELLSISLYAA